MFIDDLITTVEKTKRARFNASKRMKRSKVASTTAVAMFSTYIIAINLMVFLDEFAMIEKYITILTIVLSTLALVFSLLINLLQYESRENNFHACGEELGCLCQRLQLEKEMQINISKEKLDSYINKYHEIIGKYNLNHSEIDYIRYDFTPKTFMDRVSEVVYFIRWWIWDIYMFYWSIVFIVPALLIFLVVKNV